MRFDLAHLWKSLRRSPESRDASAIVLLISFASLLIAEGSSRAGCVHYDDYIQSIARLQIPGSAEGIAFDGQYAYIAAYDAGLVVVDVSDPSTPFVAGQIDLPGWAHEVAVREGTAYVVGIDCGLQVIDVRDVSDPRLFGSCDVPGEGRDVAVSGSTVLIAAWTAELQLVDVTFPNIPQVVGHLNLPDAATAVVADPDNPGLGYVVDYSGGAVVVDISDPAFPVWLGRVEFRGNTTDVAYADHKIYVCAGAYFSIIDVSQPESPHLIRDYNVGWAGFNAAVQGTRLYTGGTGGMAAIDVEDPSAADYLWRLRTLAECTGVAVGQGTALVIQGSLGVEVFDLEPEGPVVPFGGIDLGSPVGDMAALGARAFVIEDEGLSVVDISDPFAPALLGRLDLSGEHTPRAVAAFGDYAYLAMLWGLYVVDVSEPTVPTLAATLPEGDLTDLAVVGELLYVADQDGYLRIYELVGPGFPVVRGELQLDSSPAGVFGIAVQGSYAYVTDRRLGLFVVDVTDPAVPTIAGFTAAYGLRARIVVDGDWAYMVGSNFHIADVADPSAPEIVSTIALYGYDVDYRDTFAYVMVDFLGVAVYDVTDPYDPAFQGLVYRHLFDWFPPGPPDGLLIHEGNLYFSDKDNLQIAPVQCGPTVAVEAFDSEPRRLYVERNPTDGIVDLRFELPVAALIRLEVFDLVGRRVRTLVEDRIEAGPHRVVWSGRDRAGRRLPAGTYFIRLSGPAGLERARAVLLR